MDRLDRDQRGHGRGQAWTYRCLPLLTGNQQGWELVAPTGFTATWDGGHAKEALKIEFDQPELGGFANCHFGFGLLAIQPGYLFRAPASVNLIFRGPSNLPKAGATALEGIVEADWCVFNSTVQWQLTTPGLPVRWEKGEAVGLIVPAPRGYVGTFTPRLAVLADNPALAEAASAWEAMRNEERAEPRQAGKRRRWVGNYARGQGLDGQAAGPADHQRRPRIEPFVRTQEEPVAPTPAPTPRAGGTMLHVHNVQRCGGTGNFVYDLARALPGWRHVALCVNDPEGDPTWRADVAHYMRPLYAPKLTPAILDELDPSAVVLHATYPQHLHGQAPYGWLTEGRKVIAFHHTGSPALAGAVSAYPSEFLRRRLRREGAVVPPVGDLGALLAIERGPGAAQKITTAGKHCPAALDALNASGLEWHSKPPGRLGALPRYLAGYGLALIWSGHQETWCRTLTEVMAAGCVVIAHRAGAVSEQVQDGVNGFLFDTPQQAAELLASVPGRSDLQEIRAAARASAQRFGVDRLRRDMEGLLA